MRHFLFLEEMNKLSAIFEVNPDSRHQHDLVMMCLQGVGKLIRESILKSLTLLYTLTHTHILHKQTKCTEHDKSQPLRYLPRVLLSHVRDHWFGFQM